MSRSSSPPRLAGFLALAMLLVAMAGCGSDAGDHAPASLGPARPSSAPITKLVGEVHLHQFPLGAHGWAAFLPEEKGVPIESLAHDELVELETVPTATLDGCTLYVQPTCTPSCTGRTICLAPNVCTPFAPSELVDAGEVRVTGSREAPLIRLWFADAQSPYASDPPPGPRRLFAGGERLQLAGGSGDYAFDGAIVSPMAVVVTAPDFGAPLRLAVDAPLHVAWVSEASPHIVVTVSASSLDGRAATIRCSTSDNGALDVPRAFMAALPPRPRDVRLEVERQDDRFLPTVRAGLGVYVHAAQSTWKNDRE